MKAEDIPVGKALKFLTENEDSISKVHHQTEIVPIDSEDAQWLRFRDGDIRITFTVDRQVLEDLKQKESVDND
ncbi:hypothetical protein [Geomicrobium sp. JCM 19055]|uniref:hypothetical protein n=1 Tax=Geomicrobium sp. JCM 19055 TaxID=1460649 RepID=UPI00045ED133|nr:hypothetical protein [Geomicrobium sp. JCM 19055]GAK00922.1 hypothetical protein JCM19055_4049 [Geomicrobium sp. JCM 19055]